MLGALDYLGRGWTFDDIAEATGVSEEVHRTFFVDFVKVCFHLYVHYLWPLIEFPSWLFQVGSTILYDKWVVTPHTAAVAASSVPEFARAGLPGAVGSADGTHITLEKCFARRDSAKRWRCPVGQGYAALCLSTAAH